MALFTHAPWRLGDLSAGASELAPTRRAAWSDRTALIMCELAELAYFAFEDPGGRTGLDQRLRAGGFSLVEIFSAGCTQAYLAVSPTLAVLAFRGTTDRAGWRTNLDARLVPMRGAPEGLLVHEGFQAAFDQVRAAIETTIAARLAPGLPLYITGHSLGGALAQLAAAALDGDRLAACYTFGSPRVATEAFDGLIHTPHYRVVHDKDLVPGVPPAGPGFRHAGDPRLLLPGVDVALRRDRGVVGRFLVDVAASFAVLATGELPEIEDHMIWEYRSALERIVAARAPGPRSAA